MVKCIQYLHKDNIYIYNIKNDEIIKIVQETLKLLKSVFSYMHINYKACI